MSLRRYAWGDNRPLLEAIEGVGKCGAQAEVKTAGVCEDASTFGTGLAGKRVVAAAQWVYILCYKVGRGGRCSARSSSSFTLA